MNKKNIFLQSSIILGIIFSIGCNSRFNEDVMYGTVGNKLEKIAPGEVVSLNTTGGNQTVSINWENPLDGDLYGIKITPKAESTLSAYTPNPITLTADNPADIPNRVQFYELTNGQTYSFLVQTFDRNLNYSAGTYTPPIIPKAGEGANTAKNLVAIKGDSKVTLTWENDYFTGFKGVRISYKQTDADENSTQRIVLPVDVASKKADETYTIYDLENDISYTFVVQLFNDENTFSSESIINATPSKDKNMMQVTSLQTEENYDSSALVTWVNPEAENFYGIQITAEPAEGNLATPVYFLKKIGSDIPTSFLVTGLTNNKKYNVIIKTLDINYNLAESGASTGVKPAPTSNNQDIQNFKALPGNGYVNLYWKEPEDTSMLNPNMTYELTISPSVVNLPSIITYSKEQVIGEEEGLCQKTISGCVNGQTYTFTVRTIDISNNKSPGVSCQATPDSGSSGILDNPDLVTYKNSVKAFDFGYCKNKTEKTFSFTSSTEMNLAASECKTVMGKGLYKIESYKNITDGSVGKTTVKQADEFEITVSYTPSEYKDTMATASWDEADIIIGGVATNKIRLIGSNYPQPKDLSSPGNELKIWLRADMISDVNLSEGGKVKSMPDYSGNGYNASATDPSFEKAPLYISQDSKFNNLPVIDFSNGNISTGQAQQATQLIATSKDGVPIVQGKDGSTTFVVYTLGSSTNHLISDQTVISANYGTSWPVLRTIARYYNEDGWYVSNDYKYGLAVRGSGMAGTWRYTCISNETKNNPWNRMLITGAHAQASGISKNDKIGGNALYSCLVYDRTISSSRYPSLDPDYEWDYPSNIRAFLNGEERLLAYIESQNSSYTESYMKTNNFLESNKINTIGQYGYPWGDGKGHKYGSLPKKLINPRSTTAAGYQDWLQGVSQIEGRPFDRAMTYNSLYETDGTNSGNYESASATVGSDHFENWLPTDLWRNGTINTLTLGADFNNAYYAYSRIAEVFIFEGHLSDEEIEAMNNYIKYRYNISNISTNVADYQN